MGKRLKTLSPDPIFIVREDGLIIFRRDVEWWQRLLIKFGLPKNRFDCVVRDIDTSKFKKGNDLYLDPDHPGSLIAKNKSTKRKPTLNRSTFYRLIKNFLKLNMQ